MERGSWAVLAAGLLAGAGLAAAQDPDPDRLIESRPEEGATQLLDYTAPRLLKRGKGQNYPGSELAQQREGWVMLDMMVDDQGKPFEIGVMDSSGNPALEKAASHMAETMQFAPATLAGKPVEGARTLKVQFRVDDARVDSGATPAFIGKYSVIRKALLAGDRQSADSGLRELPVQNFYEDSYYGLLQYLYALRWGTRAEQLAGLLRALAYEHGKGYLAPDLLRAARVDLFRLLVQDMNLAGALNVYSDMDKADQRRPDVQSLVARIHAFLDSDEAFTGIQTIGRSGSWSQPVSKRQLTLAGTGGTLAEIKLRCESRYVALQFPQGQAVSEPIHYVIPPEFGACNLEVDGEPGSRFALTQR